MQSKSTYGIKADWAQSAQDSGNALGISPDIIMASGQDGIRRAERPQHKLIEAKLLMKCMSCILN